MSYARLIADESDVYVYGEADDKIVCCFCVLTPHADRHYESSGPAMIEHLLEHRRAGDLVPDDTLEDLVLA